MDTMLEQDPNAAQEAAASTITIEVTPEGIMVDGETCPSLAECLKLVMTRVKELQGAGSTEDEGMTAGLQSVRGSPA